MNLEGIVRQGHPMRDDEVDHLHQVPVEQPTVSEHESHTLFHQLLRGTGVAGWEFGVLPWWGGERETCAASLQSLGQGLLRRIHDRIGHTCTCSHEVHRTPLSNESMPSSFSIDFKGDLGLHDACDGCRCSRWSS